MRCALVGIVIAFIAGCEPPGYGRSKPDAAPEADGPDVPAMSADAGADAAEELVCERAFRLEGHDGASSVWLTGSFVSWAPDPSGGAVVFTQGGDGAWTGTYSFPPGSHQYKYIVDGTTWILDPTNPNTVDDGMGHTNNVYSCVP